MEFTKISGRRVMSREVATKKSATGYIRKLAVEGLRVCQEKADLFAVCAEASYWIPLRRTFLKRHEGERSAT
jgi:hypothetical protein